MEQTAAHAKILKQYADGPAALEAALAGLAESDLDRALAEDAWTIRQIVHHVTDGDDIWSIGIKAILGNPEGSFNLQWYWDRPQMEWAEKWQYASRPIEPSLALLRANRQHILDLVRRLPDAWEQSTHIRWPQGEEEHITVGDVLEMQAGHVFGHIGDIERIRRSHHL